MRQRRGLVWTVSVLVLVLGGLSACGDDEDTLTREEFLEQGNEICREGTERTDAIGEDVDVNSTDEEIEAAIDELADDAEGQMQDIRDLDEPDEMSDEVNAALDESEAAMQEVRDAGADILTAEKDPFEKANELLEDVGLTDCADA
jgi:vacuolar-type H+-ATPase subunit I/STV1